MTKATNTHPVVVGIDGSRAALGAVLWAIDEAVARDVSLRLVYVAAPTLPLSALYAENDVEIEYGETSLRAASSVVAETGKSVKVETQILPGPVGEALTTESKSASILCVGSVGIGWLAQRVLGSTATAVAEKAHCPVAVVRYPSEIPPTQVTHWVVVGVDDRPGNDQLVMHALDEAHLRSAPLLAVATWSSEISGVSYDELNRRVTTWRQHYPDLHIYPVTTGGGLPKFLLENRNEDVQFAVLSEADAGQIQQIIGPHDRPLAPHVQCSAMVIRS